MATKSVKEVIGKPSTEKNKENMIEFISGTRTATVTFTNPKHINRIKKLYQERGDEFKSLYENTDGSICATLPLKWIKINAGSKADPEKPKRTMSEEQKKAFAERMAAVRAAKKEAQNEED